MVKLNGKEKERLEKLAVQNNVEYVVVEAMFQEKAKELKEKGIKENLERFAVNAVLNYYRREKAKQNPSKWMQNRSKPEMVYGFLIGDMGMRDRAEEIRENAKRYINNNGIQAAIDNQLINGDNEILDSRATIFGKENPNHLEALDPKLKVRSRVLFGFFRHNGDKTFKFSSLQTSDNKLAKGWGKARLFTPCQIPMIIKEETKTEMKLNSSSAEDTYSVFKAIKEEWDIDSIITEALKGEMTKIADVEKHYEAFKDAWDRHVFLRGVVAWINIDKPTPWGSVNMSLMDAQDEEATVKVQIPKDVPIEFGELSEIIVFGRTMEDKYKDRETGEVEVVGVRVNAFGIYPIPGLSTPKDAGEAEEFDDSDEIEGWIN